MPRDLFILGAGRSGTSMVAGLFRSSGYFQGSRFYRPRDSNPRGFFEDVEVNDINETILRPVVPERLYHEGISYLADAPGPGQRWLARIPVETKLFSSAPIEHRIRTVLNNRPFCLKDPRFCYTLPLWRVHAPHARMICVFRHPRKVVASILKEVATTPYLEDFALSTKAAFDVWRLMYSTVLTQHALTGDWLFVEYSDLFNSTVCDRIAQFSEASIDPNFPDPQLNRSEPVGAANAASEALYDELVARSQVTQIQHDQRIKKPDAET
jgi:hypothetical protein